MSDSEAEGDSLHSNEGSVSGFLREARLGRVLAIERLTEKYLARLEHFANSKMSPGIKQVEDEQDIAINVLHEFFSGIMHGKYEGLRNRKQLWRLLAKITVCRVIDHFDKYKAQKRGSGRTKNASHLSSGGDLNDLSQLNAMSIDDLDPQLSVALKESYQRMLDLLGDSKDQEIVHLNLEGYENHEIARKLGVTERTVRNRLDYARQKLIDEVKR